jgi:enediyne biosynthesis protein CalE5
MTTHATASNEAVCNQVHAMWAAVASRWAEHADDVDERAAPLTEVMLARSTPQPGDRVLELACGPGGAGLAAALLVGPYGEVVLSDVAAEMTAIAASRAAARGLGNVRTATLDLERIDDPDAGYDVVLCREGLMFAVEPDRAVAEIYRVLRPGGRAAISVWGPRADNPWLSVVFDTVSLQIGSPVPPPGVPGPFSLADADRLDILLTTAGFTDIVVEKIAVPLRAFSFDAWWERTSALTGPLSAILTSLPPETQAAVTEQLRSSVHPYTTSTGLEIPGLALLATARHP